MVGRAYGSRNHGQDHQAEHVIDHGRSKDHPRLGRLRTMEILQHASGDADTRRGQRRS